MYIYIHNMYTHIYYIYNIYVYVRGVCVPRARERVHQPVAHVRHSPWLPEPCRNSVVVGRCSRSFDRGRGERGEAISIGGRERWESIAAMDDGAYVRACDLREEGALLLRSARPRSSHHEIARRTGSKKGTYPWAFLPFLPINTKVLVAHDTWYIAFRRGAYSPDARHRRWKGGRCVTYVSERCRVFFFLSSMNIRATDIRPDAAVSCDFRRATVSFAEDREMRKEGTALLNILASSLGYNSQGGKKLRIILDIYYPKIKTRQKIKGIT